MPLIGQLGEFFRDLLNKHCYLTNPYLVHERIRICLGKLARHLHNALLAGRWKDYVEQFQALLPEDLDFDYDPTQNNGSVKQGNGNNNQIQVPEKEQNNGSNRHSRGNTQRSQRNRQWRNKNENTYKSDYCGKKELEWGNGNNWHADSNDSRDAHSKRVHWKWPNTPPKGVEVHSPDP